LVLDVGNHTDNLQITGTVHVPQPEVRTDRLLPVGEELLDERLIHYRNGRRRRRVLRCYAASLQDPLSDGLHKIRAYAKPRRTRVFVRSRRGPALNDDAFPPVIAFLWRVGRKPDPLDSRQCLKLLLKLIVEGLQTFRLNSSALRIDMDNDAIGGLHANILMLQLVQALGQQSCSDEQDQR